MKELTLLFLVNDTQVLLAMKKRGFGEGKWNGIGGKLNPGETVTDALVRECQEEIGVTPISYTRAAEITFDEYVNGVRTQLFVHAFICNKWEGEPAESEEMRPEWFENGQLPLSEMWPDDEFWLPQILAGKRLKCHFILDENNKITDKSVDIVT